ncbi:MAG: hypothetical protein MRZ79_26080 [Bacteroidia bacterium]|nr:hypothetical protein [Bacteroidia bacterium]
MKHLLFVLIILSCSISFAQIDSKTRVEFELKDGYINETLYPFKKYGVIMGSRTRRKVGPNYLYKFEKFDKNLKLQDEVEFKIPENFGSPIRFSDEEKLYIIYKKSYDEYQAYSVNAQSLKVEKITGKLKPRTTITGMKVLNDFAYCQAKVGRIRSILVIDLFTGNAKYYPIKVKKFSPKKLEIADMQILENTEEIIVSVEAKISKKQNEFHALKLDKLGRLSSQDNFFKGVDPNILNATFGAVNENQYLVTGTFSNKDRVQSEGFYIASLKGGERDFVRFYKFFDLENFLSYLPEKRKAKIEKKQARKKSKGKELKLRYLLETHEIINVADGFILLAEAYYPTYRTESYTSTQTINGVTRRVTQTRTVFDGYQYTHAFLAKFDFEGELIWDQTFELWQAEKPLTPRKFIEVQESKGDQIKMVFTSGRRIIYKAFGLDGEVIKDKSLDFIETGFQGDRARWTNSNIMYWYDGFFLTYGSQKIKNKIDKGADRKRKVFFINKVAYEL